MIRLVGSCRKYLRRFKEEFRQIPTTAARPWDTPVVATSRFVYRELSVALPTRPSGYGALPPNLTFDNRSSFAPETDPIWARRNTVDSTVLDEDHAVQNETHGEKSEVTDVEGPLCVVPLPERLKANVHFGQDGTASGTLWLESSVFGVDPIRVDLLKQSVDYIRNKIRGRRKARSKTVGEVSGSGRKVRQQKGTGKARAGHSRPAHWRGGAKAHGPKNSVHYGDVKMNKKAKRLAMASALSQKLKEGNIVIVDSLLLSTHKTSPWVSLLESAFDVGKKGSSALIVDHYHDSRDEDKMEISHASHNGVPINLWVASANIPKVTVMNQTFANVYDILKRDKLIITLGALRILENRLKV